MSTRQALAELLAALRRRDYRFVTPTPATHEIVIGRDPGREAGSLRDALGWSLAFRRDSVDAEIWGLLAAADVLSPAAPELWRATIRVSTLHEHLFIHSAFPTDAQDAVFFGPDSYRFANAIAALAERRVGPVSTICDIGTGSGVGAVVAGAAWSGAAIAMTDINPRALELARINTLAAGITAHGVLGSDLSGLTGTFDLILANPPFIIDPAGRAYRDGGGGHGSAIALAMTAMALPRLRPGGCFMLYTGSAIVGGKDRLQARLAQLAREAESTLRYREVDPDIFGEELANPGYRDVDRIAAVVAEFAAAELAGHESNGTLAGPWR